MLLDLVVTNYNIAAEKYEKAALNLSRQSGNNTDNIHPPPPPLKKWKPLTRREPVKKKENTRRDLASSRNLSVSRQPDEKYHKGSCIKTESSLSIGHLLAGTVQSWQSVPLVQSRSSWSFLFKAEPWIGVNLIVDWGAFFYNNHIYAIMWEKGLTSKPVWW